MRPATHDGFVARHTLPPQMIDVSDEHDGVVDDDPHQNDEPHIRHVVERLIRELQYDPDADESERDGEHDRERLNEALEKRRHDQVDETKREDEREKRAPPVLLGAAPAAPKAPLVARRQADAVHNLADLTLHAERGAGRVGIGGDAELGPLVLALDTPRPLLYLEIRHRADGKRRRARHDRHLL